MAEKKSKSQSTIEMRNLPEECILHIISKTSPKDACRLSLVSPLFRSASESDAVWENFIPHDYKDLIARRSEPGPSLDSMTKKALFFYLCDNPILIDNGIMSFRLEKQSGKKCFMIASRALSIVSGDTGHWKRVWLPQSRFSEVAELSSWYRLEINTKVETNILSRETTYGAYFVYKLVGQFCGFNERNVLLRVYCEGQEHKNVRMVYFDPSRNVPPLPRARGDGWMEVEMGEFFNEQGEDGSVWCELKEQVDGYMHHKSGIIVEGIELRPKGVA